MVFKKFKQYMFPEDDTYSRDDMLKSILNLSKYVCNPIALRWFTIVCFAVMHINFLIFFYFLYQQYITLDQITCIIMGIWVYISYVLMMSQTELIRSVINDTNDLKPLHERGELVFKKLLRESEIMKRLLYVSFVIGLVLSISFMPVLGDEEMFYFPVKFFRCYLPTWLSWVCQIFFYTCVLHGLYTSIAQEIFKFYCLFQLKFQVYLLNDLLSEIVTDNLGYLKLFSLVDNEDYQRAVAKHLKECIKLHVRIIKFQKKVQQMMYLLLLTYFYFGCIINGLGLYFMFSEPVSYKLMRRLAFSLITLYFIILTPYYGQILSNEADRWYNLLVKCPWYLWNTSNRNMLVMITLNSQEFLTIKCSGMIRLDMEFFVKYMKIVYTIGMFLITSRNEK